MTGEMYNGYHTRPYSQNNSNYGQFSFTSLLEDATTAALTGVVESIAPTQPVAITTTAVVEPVLATQAPTGEVILSGEAKKTDYLTWPILIGLVWMLGGKGIKGIGSIGLLVIVYFLFMRDEKKES